MKRTENVVGFMIGFCLLISMNGSNVVEAAHSWFSSKPADARAFGDIKPDSIYANHTLGKLDIVYGGDHLYHAWVADNTWHYETIHQWPSVGHDPSVTGRPDGSIVIIFRDEANDWFMSAIEVSPNNYNIVKIDEGERVGRYNSIDVDAIGNVCVAYTNELDGELKYAWLDSSDKWHTEVVDDQYNARECALEFYGNLPRIAFYSPDEGNLMTTAYDSMNWQTHLILYPEEIGRDVAFYVDPTDLWHYAYYNWSQKEITYYSFRVGAWPTQTYVIDDAWSACQMDMEANAEGDLVVTYTDQDSNSLKCAVGKNGNWTRTTILSNSSYPPVPCGLELWNGVTKYVLYKDTDDRKLKLGIWQSTSTSWGSLEIDQSTYYSTNHGIALDQYMRPHICCRDFNQGTGYYAWHDGSGWKSEIAPTGEFSYTTDLEMMPNGDRVMMWNSQDSSLLRVGRFNGTNWDIKNVVSESQYVFSPEMEIGTDGSIHIVYVSTENNELVYCRIDDWSQSASREVLDQVNSNPMYIDLALDSGNRPYIAYPSQDLGTIRLKNMNLADQWTEWDLDPSLAGYPKIEVGTGGDVHVMAQSDPTGSLHYTWHQEGTGWQVATLPADGKTVRVTYGTDINHLGEFCVVYQTTESGYKAPMVRYAIRRNGSWVKESIFSGHETFLELSLKHDPFGTVYVVLGSSYTADTFLLEGLPERAYALWMEDVSLATGDMFNLRRWRSNQSASTVTLDDYILLDVYGAYWFWPSWNETGDMQRVTMSAGQIDDDEILRFAWPAGTGAIPGLRFWGALLESTSQALLMYDVIEWNAI